MFLGADVGRERLFIVFAQIVSLWMVAMGMLMWRHAGAAQVREPTRGSNE
jgi:hypothetical protein